MKIAFDFDNVIADFINTFIILAEAEYNIEVNYNNIKNYDFSEQDGLGLTPEQYKDLVNKICASNYLTGLQNQMENMYDVLSTIYHYKYIYDPIVIISNRRHRKPVDEWLKTYLRGIRYSLFLLAGQDVSKGGILRALGYDAIIEDNPKECKDILEQGFMPIVFDHPWNRELGEGYKRIKNLREVLEIV